MTKTEKILQMLEKAGERGVFNHQLNPVSFRYSARIHTLRHDGYLISTQYVKEGVYRYVLHRTVAPKPSFLRKLIGLKS